MPRTGIRNRCIEEVLALMPSLPCSHGICPVSVPFSEMRAHLAGCDHRNVQCPLYTCSWRGCAREVQEHVQSEHADDIVDMDDTISLLVGNPRGYTIDTYSQTLLRTPQGKLYIAGFWIIKGTEMPSTLIGTLTHVGTRTDGIVGRMTMFCSEHEHRIICERRPWNVFDNVNDSIRSRHNLTINWTFALNNGQIPPVFRDHDQLQKTPLASGLNIEVEIMVIDGSPKIISRAPVVDPVLVSMTSLADEDF